MKRKEPQPQKPGESFDLLPEDFFLLPEACFSFDFEKYEKEQARELERILNEPFPEVDFSSAFQDSLVRFLNEPFEPLALPPVDFSFLEATPFPPIDWGLGEGPSFAKKRQGRKARRGRRNSPKP